jgi:hypothetical protein
MRVIEQQLKKARIVFKRSRTETFDTQASLTKPQRLLGYRPQTSLQLGHVCVVVGTALVYQLALTLYMVSTTLRFRMFGRK